MKAISRGTAYRYRARSLRLWSRTDDAWEKFAEADKAHSALVRACGSERKEWAFNEAVNLALGEWIADKLAEYAAFAELRKDNDYA